MQQAEHHVQSISSKCKKQVHLARVRVAELEQRVQRTEGECDEMQMKLTVAEVQKAGAEEARSLAEARLVKAGSSMEEAKYVKDLEDEVSRLREEAKEVASLKKTCMVLASELKKRGCVLKAEEPEENPAEDTDYITDSSSCSSRQLSPASEDED